MSTTEPNRALTAVTRPSRRLPRVLAFLGVALALAIAGNAVYHHSALPTEAAQLEPPGMLVEVAGHMIHVVAEGPAQDARPTVILLAGAATIAPVYDFAELSGLLATTHRTVIVEELGYGFSDIVNTDRSVDTLVNETREALRLADIRPPYVLIPHSMSGLEVLWWAERHPGEVAAVIGLDMSTPEGYEGQSEASIAAFATAGRVGAWLGLQRIPGLYPGLNVEGLTDEERRQQELLLYRNAGNMTVIRESERVLQNATSVGLGATLEVPTLLFSSHGRDLGDAWVTVQRDLADRSGAILTVLDCGHRVHHCAPDQIAAESLVFLGTLG